MIWKTAWKNVWRNKVRSLVVIISVAVCGVVFGQRICSLLGSGCSSSWLTVVVGMSALHLVSFLGSVTSLSASLETVANVLVGLGVLIKTVAFLFGLGALINSRFGGRRPTPQNRWNSVPTP
mgnify:CR=1 FL=1